MDARRGILHALREQARLRDTGGRPSEAWTPQQWWESFVYLFVNAGGGYCASGHGDDLLFFIRAKQQQQQKQQQQGADGMHAAPFFVRRRGPQLPEDLQLSGREFEAVDWAASVLLNLVLHSRYQLTVVACGRESLAFVAEGRTWAPRMRAVARPVYASPTVTAVNLDSSRADAANPAPCYPDVCFAVDNFDATFDDLVLSDPDHCYCVVLHALLDDYAHGSAGPTSPLCGFESAAGASTGGGIGSSSGSGGGGRGSGSGTSEQQQQQQQQQQQGQQQHAAATLPNGPAPIRTASGVVSGDGSGSPSGTARPHGGSSGGGSVGVGASPSGWRIGTRQRCLFAGYVSYDQITAFIAASRGNGRGLLDSFWGPPPDTPRDKVVMTGPGGVGRAEVAVTRQEASAAAAAAAGGGGDDSGGFRGAAAAAAAGGGGLLQRARAVASTLQRALAPDGGAGGEGTAGWSVQCALMLLRLPVDHLAREVLEGV